MVEKLLRCGLYIFNRLVKKVTFCLFLSHLKKFKKQLKTTFIVPSVGNFFRFLFCKPTSVFSFVQKTEIYLELWLNFYKDKMVMAFSGKFYHTFVALEERPYVEIGLKVYKT